MVSRYAVIDDTKVVNIAMAEPDFAAEMGWAEVQDHVGPGWVYENGEFSPPPPTPEPPPPSREEQEAARKAAYEAEADPIFFMAQRGEATMEEWQAKVAEIKARFPYP